MGFLDRFKGRPRGLDTLPDGCRILLLTGIASPKQLAVDLAPLCRDITPMAFGDHHAFTQADVERINSTFASMPQPRLIVTTEKDAARLVGLDVILCLSQDAVS